MTLGLRAAYLALITLSSVGVAAAQEEQANATPYPASEIEQVVAPIALYPDSLLAQVFMASTYPMEVVEAARWRDAHKDLKDKALEDALKSQNWDASVKSLTTFPEVLSMMNEKLDWTQKLGDIFLAQQQDVMDAVQRLRAKAKAEGNLESNEQQVVTEAPPPAGATTTSTTIIEIEPANPQVVYVPSYNPTVVYGAWPYPAYPPYSPYPPGYVWGTAALSFGMGMATAALWGNCNWGGGDIDVDVNNNFNRNTNIDRGDRTTNRGDRGSGKWNHDSKHRKGAGYRDQATQNKFGKGDRAKASSRDQFRGRAEQGRQQIGREGAGNVQRDLDRAGGARGDRAGAGGSRPSASNRAGAGGSRPSASNRAGAGSSRPSASNRASSSGRGSSTFGGDRSGSQARRDSSRGHSSQRSSMSGSRGGSRSSMGGSRGGGGGGRGGGGGGRGGGGGGRGGGRR